MKMKWKKTEAAASRQNSFRFSLVEIVGGGRADRTHEQDVSVAGDIADILNG
jgi:hypothetical protein